MYRCQLVEVGGAAEHLKKRRTAPPKQRVVQFRMLGVLGLINAGPAQASRPSLRHCPGMLCFLLCSKDYLLQEEIQVILMLAKADQYMFKGAVSLLKSQS